MTQAHGFEKGARRMSSEEAIPQPVLRFAPSPNGPLHLGHAYSALFTAAVADTLGGRFILRIEDIDTTRSRAAYVEGIHTDLEWLGLTWSDAVRHQSAHMEDYGAALERLKTKGLVYPSRASRKTIGKAVAALEKGGKAWPRDPDGAPLYPRQALQAGDGEAGAVAWRLDVSGALSGVPDLHFTEMGPGAPRGGTDVVAAPQAWGDVLLARKDIATSYHLSVVVDDALEGVTHVTRGSDLAAATHVHRLLQHHLDLPVPVYCHHQLLKDDEGRKLAKSAGSKSLADLRDEGFTARDVHRLCGLDNLKRYFDGLV